MKELEEQRDQQYLDEYFNDVQPYSEEHLKDIENFSRLLESMQKPGNSRAEKRAIVELQKIIYSFNDYKRKNDLILKDSEKKEVSIITGSGFSPIVKKRMMEDLIYKTKKRHHDKIKERHEQKIIDKEIREIRRSKSIIVCWFNLMKFAFDYGTITLFSHKLKESAFSIIRDEVSVWQKFLEKSLKEILDKEYYLLSTLEYNSLAVLLDLEKPLEDIKKISSNSAYNSFLIAEEIDSFAKYYITILKNKEYIENGCGKIYKKRKPQHGFWGMLKNILDQPIYNNQPVRWSQYDMIRKSVTGALLSYYTAREKVIIRTINQIIYILGIDGKIDHTKKHLTRVAAKNEETKRDQEKSGRNILIKKIDEYERITEKYLKGGPNLEDIIFKKEAKSLYSSWLSEITNKPMFRFIKLVGGFIKYFIDPINSDDDFILLYDNIKHEKYFETKKEIKEAVSNYNLVEFDLLGTKANELEKIKLESNITPRKFIYSLTKFDAPASLYTPSLNLAKSILKKISNRSYDLAIRLNKLITDYYNHKEIIDQNDQHNYDFFANALITKTKKMKAHLILKKESITLKDFLEAACSLAFYIAQELDHEGIEAIYKDRDRVITKLENLTNEIKVDITDEIDSPEPEAGGELLEEINQIYRDSITGLWRFEYFKDQIVPRLYDEKEDYKLDIPRFLFFCEINDFDRINRLLGHDSGDRILREVIQVIERNIIGEEKHKNNTILRYQGASVIGYINNINLLSAIDTFSDIRSEINKLSFNIKDFDIDIDIDRALVSTAIYQERKGSNVNKNIEIIKNIMKILNRNGQNNIGFTKNSEKIISNRDYNPFGDLDEEIITILS